MENKITERILTILDNVRYWENCPEDYKKDINAFLEENTKSQIKNIPVFKEIKKQNIDYNRGHNPEKPKTVAPYDDYVVCTKCDDWSDDRGKFHSDCKF